jgi:hypothetical protein
VLRDGIYAKIVKCSNSLRVLFGVVLFNHLKSNLEMNSKLNGSIEELSRQEV